MKKKYVAPESEYINFDAEDLQTSVQPPVQAYAYSSDNSTSGDGVVGEGDTEYNPSTPDLFPD